MNQLVKHRHFVPAVCAAVVLLILAGGYLMLVSPKQSKAASLRHQVADTKAQLALAEANKGRADNSTDDRAPDLFRFGKAMPDRVDTAGAVLDIAAVAKENGVTVVGFQPSVPVVAGSGYESAMITTIVEGRYGAVTAFLGDLERLVSRQGDRIDARGRLFGVDQVQFAAGEKGLPQVKATINLETYVYSPSATTAAASPTTTDSTTTTTTSAPPSGATAAGASG